MSENKCCEIIFMMIVLSIATTYMNFHPYIPYIIGVVAIIMLINLTRNPKPIYDQLDYKCTKIGYLVYKNKKININLLINYKIGKSWIENNWNTIEKYIPDIKKTHDILYLDSTNENNTHEKKSTPTISSQKEEDSINIKEDKYCNFCGCKIDANAKFCRDCGSQI